MQSINKYNLKDINFRFLRRNFTFTKGRTIIPEEKVVDPKTK